MGSVMYLENNIRLEEQILLDSGFIIEKLSFYQLSLLKTEF